MQFYTLAKNGVFMKLNKHIILILIFTLLINFLSPLYAGKDANRIWMDGEFTDWDTISPIYTDPSGDQQSGNIDFGTLKITNDSRYIYFCIEIGEELNLQDDNEITLYIDTDNNSATGTEVNGIGAEVEWVFGERQGNYSFRYTIYHQYIGLVTCPTVTSDKFEIAVDRTLDIFGQELFPENSFSVVFHDNDSGNDYIPNIGDIITYDFDNTSLPPIETISLEKSSSADFRIMTYNVLSNNFFESSLYDEYDRILSAIQPDIIGFQEIYDKSANQVKQRVESMIPAGSGEEWYCDTIVGDDVFAVSKYPIIDKFALNKCGAFLIDFNSKAADELLLIVAHLSFGNYNTERQLEIDELMAFIREAKEPGGTMTLEENTPILITGDLNLVGYAQQLETLLTGDIVNTQFGPSFSPDWDGSDFGDLMARQTHLPQFYTWYSETSSYSPGRLDFMIYSDYVLYSENKFVLFTPEMDADTLTTYGLQINDVTSASDHLPLVSDFKIYEPGSVSVSPANSKAKIWNSPNPVSKRTTINFIAPNNADNLHLNIFNVKGEKIKSFYLNRNEKEIQKVTWNCKNARGADVSAGVYLFQLKTNNSYTSGKLVLLKN